MQAGVAGELGPVVESHGFAQLGGNWPDQLFDQLGDAIGVLGLGPRGDQNTAATFVQGEDGLAVLGEHHEIGFPVPRGLPVVHFEGALGNGNAGLDEGGGPSAAHAAPSAFALGARQVVAPAVVLGARDLGVDEAVDGLVADEAVAGVALEAAGDLLWGPALGEAIEHGAAQVGLAFQARALPAPRLCLLVGKRRLIADFATSVALELASNCRWRAIQSCRDLPDRAPIGLKSGNLATVLQ